MLMYRTRTLLTCLLVTGSAAATLWVPTVSIAAGDRRDAPRTVADDSGAALQRLRADSPDEVVIRYRRSDGASFVHGGEGKAMVQPLGDAPVGPRAAAEQYLRRYGALVGVDGTGSAAVIDDATPSASGGTVVRAQQQVGGLPVFGGEVVMSLDTQQGLTSLAAATAPEIPVPAPVVSQADAERAAMAVTAKAHLIDRGALSPDPPMSVGG